ncbi:hypothetical protein GCM10025864_39120 [Luteimicrobium album]|uniref:Uncharacterized protein n=1 Tax=Luteimicrobium album TaxID=1054550 RepID=A0ABQ6I863_9MICO|nr:hypothetical protein [Luteimicrobium album]GMA26153.1 hypothetical protein GCM10025864_39120 [Luteimicrobium album]
MNPLRRFIRKHIVSPGPADVSRLDRLDGVGRHPSRFGPPVRPSSLTPAEHRAEVARLAALASPIADTSLLSSALSDGDLHDDGLRAQVEVHPSGAIVHTRAFSSQAGLSAIRNRVVRECAADDTSSKETD